VPPSGTLTARDTSRTGHAKCSNRPRAIAPRYTKGGRTIPRFATSGTIASSSTSALKYRKRVRLGHAADGHYVRRRPSVPAAPGSPAAFHSTRRAGRLLLEWRKAGHDHNQDWRISSAGGPATRPVTTSEPLEPACARHGGNAIVAARIGYLRSRPLSMLSSISASIIGDNSPWVWTLLISLESLARMALPLSNETEVEGGDE
jgi:hypothetical protein